MKPEQGRQKIGDGHLSAFGRQGLAEIRAALYPESPIAQKHAEYGLYGTRTPGEVAAARQAEAHELDEEPQSQLDQYVKQAELSREDRERVPREIERDV